MRLIMTGLDHRRAEIGVREMFALTKDRTGKVLTAIKDRGGARGCVIISTCNRTELYASVPDGDVFDPTKALCGELGRNHEDYSGYFTERENERAFEHLCRVAAGLDSRIVGEDQIITQVREALELSRGHNCANPYIETMFNLAIQAAKAIKTNVILKSFGTDSVAHKTVEKLKTICAPAGLNAVVIGNGQMGRLVAELLIREKAKVTVTVREYKRGIVKVPDHAYSTGYSERYKAIEQADIVISVTASPHYTIFYEDINKLTRFPAVIVDLAVPRDVDPGIADLPGVTLLTIDDISGESRALPPESLEAIDSVIAEHKEKYYRWQAFREGALPARAGGVK